MSKQTRSTPSVMEAITASTEPAGAEQSPKPTASELPTSDAQTSLLDNVEPSSGDAPASSTDDPIMSLTEAGVMFGRSRQTVANWCAEGLLEYVRLPGTPVGRRGIRKSTVLKFIGGTNVLAERGHGNPRGLQETRQN